MSNQTSLHKAPVISSIGVINGGCIIRVILPTMKMVVIQTNLTSFAKLAELGVCVING